ncbi:Eukaryotic translation initiation factor 3 subunit D like protein [Verticillium longisporum]|uniref:Eukaryotic translation initiation factor 3 subunit D like protein n=1 Tax=Verticillium longisporum TaxID=100787 RepID=A0A8I2ZUJ6_VERLO|nr:Eukaryotic translation initiation factor 3 subunit D like protein [Verticillium longisporum]
MAQNVDWVTLVENCPAGDGWGPSVTSDTTLNGVPYAPFSKGDKLGRMADWTADGKGQDGRGGRQQYNRNYRDQQVYGASHAVTFNAPPAEDESSFSVVSNTRDSTKTRYGRGAVFTRGGRGGARGGRGDARGGRTTATRGGAAGGRGGYGGFDSRGGRGGAGGRGGRRFGWKDYDKPARNRDASINIRAPRSVYSWDVVIVRQGNKIFLDKRDNAALDMVTVNENAADAPLEASEGSKDTVNQPSALAEEATYINHNFANQVVLEGNSKVDMPNSNPFYNASEDTDPPASKAYKYRRFDLSTSDEEPVHLIVRTEVDAVQKNAISGEDQYLTVKALNEFDSKAQGSGGALDWRQKLVSQRGAVVATEMKNNSCKLARWTVQSILAKSDVMKLGFVSRVNPRSNDKHVILGVVGWKPRDFASQMNLSLSNGWGIVRTIADMILAREEGKYILVKDPNKSMLRLYQIPSGSLDDEEEEEEGAAEEEEEEE